MKPVASILLTLFLGLAALAGLSSAAEPGGTIRSSNWGMSTHDSYDTSYNYGWSFTRPPEYRPVADGIELVLCYDWNCNRTISWLWRTRQLE